MEIEAETLSAKLKELNKLQHSLHYTFPVFLLWESWLGVKEVSFRRSTADVINICNNKFNAF